MISWLCHAQPADLVYSNIEKAYVLSTYLRVRDGLAPSSDLAKTTQLAAQSDAAARKTQSELNEQTPENARCSRFVKTSQALIQDLLLALQTISLHPGAFGRAQLSDFDFEAVNRFRITSAALAEINFLLQSGAEGGYSLLDLRSRQACQLKNRAGLTSDFSTLLRSLGEYTKAAIGLPGVFQMQADEDRLLRLSLADESHDRKMFWLGLGIGGSAASAIIWKFGPTLAAAAIRSVLGYSPRILAVPIFLYGVKVSALVAEGMAFSYADQWLSTNEPPPRMILGSWDEHMDALDILVKSPVHSPALELAFLSRIYALIVSDFGPSLTPTKSFVEAEAKRWGSVENAVEHYKPKEMD
jgi:hypothetical protein